MSGDSSIEGSTAKRSQISAIAIDPVRQRYGRAKALSTAAGAAVQGSSRWIMNSGKEDRNLSRNSSF
jgi:hypothetical protein